MKKTIAAIFALAFSVNALAQASFRIDYKIEWSSGYVTNVSTTEGVPAAYSDLNAGINAVCTFKPAFGQSKLTISTQSGRSATIIPDQTDSTGVKTFLVLAEAEAKPESATLKSGDCSVPVGRETSWVLREVRLLPWGKRTAFKLPNENEVFVTATKAQ